MSQERYDEGDDRAMREVQKAIVDAILPHKDRVPSWLICLALARVLRVILRKAPKPTQGTLLPTLFAYLRGDTQQPGDSPLLWTPDRAN